MALRRVSLWVDEEVYDDYKVFARSLGQSVGETMRNSLQVGLPASDELTRDFGLPPGLLRTNGGAPSGVRPPVWRRLMALTRRGQG
jgi:hypothetical protein